jgi:hypothetical protein
VTQSGTVLRETLTKATFASSTTKTGRHDIAEILLKVALKHKKSIKSKLKGDLDFAFDINIAIIIAIANQNCFLLW